MTQHEDHAFASADEADLAYRSLSAAAVVSLLLGLLSSLAFLTPYLSLLPLVAVAVSLGAVRSVSASGGAKSGLGLAVTGLFLSVAIASAAFARDFVRDRNHQADAAVVAQEFLRRLSEGEVVGAMELTVAYDQRMTSTDAARLYYQTDDEASETLRRFSENRVIAALTGAPTPALERFAGVTSGRFGKLNARQIYAAPKESDAPIRLDLERASPRSAAAVSWRVAVFEFAD